MIFCKYVEGQKMKYEKPIIITYTEEEIAAIVGPAQTNTSWYEEELG